MDLLAWSLSYLFCTSQDVIAQFGADTVRLFMLFKAPPDAVILWDTEGAVGGEGVGLSVTGSCLLQPFRECIVG